MRRTQLRPEEFLGEKEDMKTRAGGSPGAGGQPALPAGLGAEESPAHAPTVAPGEGVTCSLRCSHPPPPSVEKGLDD